MPSEHRLHPLSVGFWLGGQVRRAILPLIFGAASASFVGGIGLRTIVLVSFILLTAVSIVRYLTFRYRYEASELVIRTGLIFRRERHVPYARIQNLDAVQGVFHRVLGVVEVKIQTGGGKEPEATMTVIPLAALEELRQRVFEERDETSLQPEASEGPPPIADLVSGAAVGGHTLLHLPPRELILYGLIQNRGMLVIAAAFGAAWEVGFVERASEWAVGEGSLVQSLIRDVFTGPSDGGVVAGRFALVFGAVAAVLIFARLLSIAWALVRLHDYKVVRAGEDLRTTFGLLTQVAATIPLRRIQKVTIHEGPLHRWAKRVAVRVETAGGVGSGDRDPHRQWLAPILPHHRLPEFLAEIVPELDLGSVTWEGAAPGAFRRRVKAPSIMATAVAIPCYVFFGAWGAAAHLILLAWAGVYARRYVRHLGWAVKDDAVLFKSGWLWRRTSIARFAKIQVVRVSESPFDRRRQMARMHVDTAGAGAASHKLEIPYMAVATARGLGERLSAEAAQTAFRW